MSCFIGFLVLGGMVAALHYLAKWYARDSEKETVDAPYVVRPYLPPQIWERDHPNFENYKAAAEHEFFMKYGPTREYDSMMLCYWQETQRQRQANADTEYLSWINR